MLQNRVDPFGNIIRTAARGSWMGNRGILHDDHRNIQRPYKLKAWITCVLEFRGRKRAVMSPHRYTELFFFDEATSFAAGHRPCFECRRKDFQRFKTHWLQGNPEYGFHEKTPIISIDEIIHRERIDRAKAKITFEESKDLIPDGVFVSYAGKPYLIFDNQMHEWSPFGYQRKVAVPHADFLTVLTPKSIVNTFRAGYLPQMSFTSKLP